jgi:hypothetical protein
MSRIFDPLGLIAPVTVKPKIFLQQLLTEVKPNHKLGCDDTLLESYLQECDYYQKGMSRVNEVKILLVLCPTGSVRFKLHGFSDASERAYSSVTYLRRFGCDETITVQIMCQNKSGIAEVTVHFEIGTVRSNVTLQTGN